MLKEEDYVQKLNKLKNKNMYNMCIIQQMVKCKLNNVK